MLAGRSFHQLQKPTLKSMFNPLNSRRILSLFLSVMIPFITLGCSKKTKIEGHLKRAEAYFAAKDFAKAEIEFLNVLKLDSANVASIKNLAGIYYDAGKTQQAAHLLLSLRELDKDNVGNRMKLAKIFLSARQLEDSRKEAIFVLEREPKNDEAITILADTSVTERDIADTRERLENLREQAVDRASWNLAMANLSLVDADFASAENFLNKAQAAEPQSSRVQQTWSVFYSMQRDREKTGKALERAAEFAPLEPLPCIRLAEFKLRSGLVKEGREIMEQFTAKVPDASMVWMSLARLNFDEKKLPECARIVEQILAKDPENFQARLLHAELTREKGDTAEAVKEAEKLKDDFESSPEVRFVLAQAHLRNRDLSNASANLEETLKLAPNFSRAALLQGELLIRTGNFADAVTLLKDLIEKHPEIVGAQTLLGGAYASLKRYDEALAIYRSLERKFPDEAEIPFAIGMTYRLQPSGNADARKAFDRAAELAPENSLVCFHLVDLDLAEKNYAAALERVRLLLAKKPKLAAAKIVEGQIHLAQRNLEEAKAALKTAIEWEPKSDSAYGLLTQAYLAGNQLPDALDNLQQILTRNPNNVRAGIEKAMILEKQGELVKSVAAYEDVLKTAPDLVPALNNLAFILSEKLQRHDDAFALASKAKKLAPQDPAINDTLGWIHFRRREYPQALTLLQESAGKLPGEPEVQFHAGMAHYMMGQESPARVAFQRALEREGEFTGRADAATRLAILDINPEADAPSAIATLQAGLAKQPDDLVAQIRLAQIFERTGAPEKARQIYEEARKINPSSVSVLFRFARLFANGLKDPAQALSLASEARKLAPDDADVAHLLGRITYEAGDHTKAVNLLRECSRKQPENTTFLFDLARAAYAVGRVDEAEDTMRRAAGVGSLKGEQAKEAESFIDLIALSKSPEKLLAAEARVKEIIETRPNDLSAMLLTGSIQDQKGQNEEARQTYDKIVSQFPQFAPARKLLANLYTEKLGDQEKALEQASKAREVLTGDPELAKILGKIAFRQGDLQKATIFLQESSLKRTEDAELFFYLGMTHSQKKAKEECRRALERAIRLSPEAPFAPEATRVLAELNL